MSLFSSFRILVSKIGPSLLTSYKDETMLETLDLSVRIIINELILSGKR